MRQQVLTIFFFAISISVAQGATFTPLGDLPGGIFQSGANGISADGSVVVGYSVSRNPGSLYIGDLGAQAFRWTAAGGMVGLGYLADDNADSFALDVSADGSVVVGYGRDPIYPDEPGRPAGREAFRWTSGGGMVGLGQVSGGGETRTRLAVSADGSVVVGGSAGGAFRWSSEQGMVGLGALPGANSGSYARNVSADGSVIVGGSGSEAFRWSGEQGMVGLGYLGEGEHLSTSATDISADGNVVVGQSHNASGSQAFRWTATGGMVGLGYLDGSGPGVVERYPDFWSVSADGDTALGYYTSIGGYEIYLWRRDRGMQRLLDVLLANGADGVSGWTLYNAVISADGQWVAGSGLNPLGQGEGFLANIAAVPLPASAWLIVPAIGLIAPYLKRRRNAWKRSGHLAQG